jgi:hypothetical protein
MSKDLTIAEKRTLAEKINWTSQGWPLPKDREESQALQNCYSWLAWRDLPLAIVPENDGDFDEFVSSNIFLKIRLDGRNLRSMSFVTKEYVETFVRKSGVIFVPAAFGAEKMLTQLNEFEFSL